jgi:hypothetical protein
MHTPVAARAAQVWAFAFTLNGRFFWNRATTDPLRYAFTMTRLDGFAEWMTPTAYIGLYFTAFAWVGILAGLFAWAVVSFVRQQWSVRGRPCRCWSSWAEARGGGGEGRGDGCAMRHQPHSTVRAGAVAAGGAVPYGQLLHVGLLHPHVLPAGACHSCGRAGFTTTL